jgi:hypothetical protein
VKAPTLPNGIIRIAYDKVGRSHVSTVFAAKGVKLVDGRTVPKDHWETKVVNGTLHGEVAFYHSDDEAKAGHRRMVERVRSFAAFLAKCERERG